MPTDPSPPPPLPRPPVRGWMWAVCGLGMIPVCAVIGAVCVAGSGAGAEPGVGAATGVTIGMILGVPMIGGLALASRFISGTAGRLFGALAFGLLLVIGLGGVAFAGCVCLISGGKFH